MKIIGYWKCDREPLLPDPKDYIDAEWANKEKLAVIQYLEKGSVKSYYMGYSKCRICGCKNGCADLTDGVYVWPEGFAHYLKDHSVKPPQDFIDYVLERK